MIFIVAIVLAVTAAIALRNGDRVWAVVLMLGLVPTVLSAFGFVIALVLAIAYLARVTAAQP